MKLAWEIKKEEEMKRWRESEESHFEQALERERADNLSIMTR